MGKRERQKMSARQEWWHWWALHTADLLVIGLLVGLIVWLMGTL